MMSEWQCSSCYKTYIFDEYLKLNKVKMKDDDSDPINNYGYTPVCTCGKVFHKDKWKLSKEIGDYWISTVHLELNHAHKEGEELYYETMIFEKEATKKSSFSDRIFREDHYQERYRSKQDAINGHNSLVIILESGTLPEGWYN